jgi:hypothetical protein
VILIRVPYGKRSEYIFMPALGRFWKERGYAFVVQDVRGRFGSEGSFTPFSYGAETFQPGGEVSDAYDTLDWIAAQGWCDGNIGMMGESYYGFTTLAGAWSGHPALKAISPADITVARERRVLDGAFPLQAGGLWTLEMDDIERGEYQDVADLDLLHLPLIAMGEAHAFATSCGGSGSRIIWSGPRTGVIGSTSSMRGFGCPLCTSAVGTTPTLGAPSSSGRV